MSKPDETVILKAVLDAWPTDSLDLAEWHPDDRDAWNKLHLDTMDYATAMSYINLIRQRRLAANVYRALVEVAVGTEGG